MVNSKDDFSNRNSKKISNGKKLLYKENDFPVNLLFKAILSKKIQKNLVEKTTKRTNLFLYSFHHTTY